MAKEVRSPEGIAWDKLDGLECKLVEQCPKTDLFPYCRVGKEVDPETFRWGMLIAIGTKQDGQDVTVSYAIQWEDGKVEVVKAPVIVGKRFDVGDTFTFPDPQGGKYPATISAMRYSTALRKWTCCFSGDIETGEYITEDQVENTTLGRVWEKKVTARSET